MILARRGFLCGLGAALATPAIVRAGSIWVPPAKAPLIGTMDVMVPGSVPGRASLLTLAQITREAMKMLQLNNAFLDHMDTQYEPAWDRSFVRFGVRTSAALRIRLPQDSPIRPGHSVPSA